jgi:FPC/CPF motif-containing protein YcgG
MITQVDDEFRKFVGGEGFSCLAGKGVVKGGEYTIGVYGVLGSARSSRALAGDLSAFAATVAQNDPHPRAFVAVFPTRPPADEQSFEQRLWEQLGHLRAADAPDAAWDPMASDDPDDPHFAFSFARKAFFIVGLHAASSRLSRRFRWPALVFNPHAQFDRLRSHGKFDRLRGMIRDREIALQGSLNPNLADFGERSEARQYSGRAVEPDWQCPFHRRDA